MQLTSTDEADLLMPLYAGVQERTQWSTFLSRIRRRTGADYASLIFAQGDVPMHLTTEVFVGRNIREEARLAGLEDLYSLDRMPYGQLRPGRVYSPAEFVAHDKEFREFHLEFNRRLNLTDERIVRIKEQEGTNAWLTLARNAQEFSSADGALLGAIAPHVAIALRNFVVSERLRIQAVASHDGIERVGAGWIALDRDARVIDIAPRVAAIFQNAWQQHRLIGERLYSDNSETRKIVVKAAAEFAQNPAAPMQAVQLLDDPRLDAILVPVVERPAAALALPVMLAFCRTDREVNPRRVAILSTLFDLPVREAELALALSDGRSIVEAAALMGLTEDTARNYSKRLYAKLRVRGQVDLVRLIYGSSAWML